VAGDEKAPSVFCRHLHVVDAIRCPASVEHVARVAEGALAEHEDLPGRDSEHERLATVLVLKPVIANRELPLTVPPAGPRLGEERQPLGVGNAGGGSFDDDVETTLPVVAAGCQNLVRVVAEVDRLCSVRSRAEVEGVLEPDGDQGSHMRPSTLSNGRDPEELGGVRAPAASPQPVGTASGSLKRESSSVVGAFTSGVLLRNVAITKPSRLAAGVSIPLRVK
jgi:hypothetical protein